MSAVSPSTSAPAKRGVQTLHFFQRFTRLQRWEHALLILSFVVLFLTGVVQKYRGEVWSQQILSTPDRLLLIRNIHHIAAIVLTLEVVFHLGRAIYLLAKRRMSPAMFPTWQDVRDAGGMPVLAVLQYKPRRSRYPDQPPDYYAEETDDWIVYPWETEE